MARALYVDIPLVVLVNDDVLIGI